ncbi:RQC-minor-1 family DNA-binding protein [Massilia cavernae]|uniref:RQC domain protein n=1 Tax=Massilia cavernae TaxID=2320864 RepID=A0A418XGE1_9BURK|nr:RQC-minor-1 family DNA-binding protein [Massilia cavernae]RJG11515.1 RQC domain protein [Massilia cavernae]
MTRRPVQVRVHLDAKGIRSLPAEDVRAILRAADPLIATGGRSLLAKVLRGSRASDVLSHDLDKNPCYGFYRDVSEEDVLARIDWTILHGYLAIHYSGRLPFLVYTPAGWKIERETYADEIIRDFDAMLAGGVRPYPLDFLKDMNRELVFLVLDKIQAALDPKYLPVLEDWAQVDARKVRERIHAVTQRIADRPA